MIKNSQYCTGKSKDTEEEKATAPLLLKKASMQ